MTTPPLLQRVLPPIRFLGTWTCLCLGFFMIVLAISYFKAGSINYSNNQSLVDLSANQGLLTEQITKNALAIEIAVRTQDWDSVEPSLLKLIDDHNTWKSGHESLLNNRANTFQAQGDEDTIAEHLSKQAYPFNQLNQSMTELETVTRSVVRRAPYIDPKSLDRIAAAVKSHRTHDESFKAAYAQITELYKLSAAQSSIKTIASIRSLLLIALAAIAAAIATGVAPRLWRQSNKIETLRHENARANKALADLGPSQPKAEPDPESNSDSDTPHQSKLAA